MESPGTTSATNEALVLSRSVLEYGIKLVEDVVEAAMEDLQDEFDKEASFFVFLNDWMLSLGRVCS